MLRRKHCLVLVSTHLISPQPLLNFHHLIQATQSRNLIQNFFHSLYIGVHDNTLSYSIAVTCKTKCIIRKRGSIQLLARNSGSTLPYAQLGRTVRCRPASCTRARCIELSYCYAFRAVQCKSRVPPCPGSPHNRASKNKLGIILFGKNNMK